MGFFCCCCCCCCSVEADSLRTNVSFFLMAMPPTTLTVSAAAALPPLAPTAALDLLFWPNEAGGVLVANTGGVLDPKEEGEVSGVRGDEEPAEPVDDGKL